MEGEREFAFKHQLTREVAYASVPKSRRARLHAAFADWLEQTHGKEELAALLAHHYAEAARPEDADLAWDDESELARVRAKAARWLRRAGELAVGRYELDDGLALLHRAVELETDQVATSELWREIGRANALGFRGAEFWDAMQKSLAVCTDPVACGETYAELGYQTSFRAGMWQTAPDRELVFGWINRALELAEPGSPSMVKALVAKVLWADEPLPDDARAASELADRLGDPELRAAAFNARSLAAWHEHDFEHALAWARRPFDLLPELHDPEKISEVYEQPIASCAMLGRFPEARRIAAKFDESTQRLSPHHRLHGIAVTSELEELIGDWDGLRALSERVEERVAINLRTPCVRNMRTLLVCSLAYALGRDDREAARLEEKAESLQMHGYDRVLLAPRLRLALYRGDVERVQELLVLKDSGFGRSKTYWMSIASDAARLDALCAVGDWEQAEPEAESLLVPGSYLEPFALRALGQVHRRPELVRRALTRFEELKLDWHAEQTRALLSS
jgi:hypothetical protein